MSDYEGYINSELTNLRKQNAALREQLAAKDNALSEIIELYDPYTNAPTDKFMYERAKAARGEDE